MVARLLRCKEIYSEFVSKKLFILGLHKTVWQECHCSRVSTQGHVCTTTLVIRRCYGRCRKEPISSQRNDPTVGKIQNVTEVNKGMLYLRIKAVKTVDRTPTSTGAPTADKSEMT